MGRLRKSRRFAFLAVFGLIAAWLAAAPSAAVANGGLPPGLRPTEVDVTSDQTHRWGEPQIAVNQKNPNNLVYIVMSDQLTYACEQAGDPNCTVSGGFVTGLNNVPGWIDASVFVSSDRGKSWTDVPFPGQPPGHPPLEWKGDPMVTATPDGNFYIAWDAIHLAGLGTYGCIAVSKSTDGGQTWSDPTCTGTPVDRPWLETDLSTGTLYEVSSGFLGPIASGDPTTPQGTISDRWLVSSQDGVHWSTPQRLGGTDGVSQFSAASSSRISAANGVLAATFRSTSGTACSFFVGGAAPCTVFETTTNSGATWTRHRIPVPDASSGQVMVTADPTRPGHYTIGVLQNSSAGAFLIYQTTDSGVTWTGPTVVTEDNTKTHQRPWMAVSPDGVIGIMWRSNEAGAGPTFPYRVWAAISKDGGATFSDPLQITTAPSPAPDPLYLGSDDFSFINLSHQDAFVGWADWRPGERAGFFSAIKLQAFNH